MANEIVVDRLVTELGYKHDEATVKRASQAVQDLRVENERAAASADKLSHESQRLTGQLDKLETRADSLRAAQLQLAQAIGDRKPTAAQRAEMKRLALELREVSLQSRRLRRDARQVSQAERKVGTEAKKAARDVKRLERALAQANKQSKSTGKGFSGLAGKLGGAFAGGAAVAGIQQAVSLFAGFAEKVFDTSSEFQRLRASLVTVTGSSREANKAFEGIREFAAETPFQVTQISEAFVKLKAMGLDPSERALKSYGNTASAMGKDLNQMVEAVADASVGEFERLKEFGIKAKTQGDQVAFTFQGQTTTIKKDAAAIEEYLMRIGEVQFAGAMEEQMATLGGRLSNLQDKFDAFLLKVGESGPIDSMGEAIAKLSELLTDEAAESLGEVTDEGVGVFQALLDEFDAETMEGILKLLVILAKALSLALKGLIKVVGFFADQLAAAGRIAGKVGDAFGTLRDKIGEVREGTADLGDAWDAVTDSLAATEDQAIRTQGALVELVKGAAIDKALQLAGKVDRKTQELIDKAQGQQLAILAQSDNPAVAAAAQDKIDQLRTEREERLTEKAGKNFQTKAGKEADQGIKDAAQDRADEVYDTLTASGVAPSEAKKQAAVAYGERIETLTTAYEITGKAPPPRKKKGKKPKLRVVEKEIRQRIDQLAEQAGQRAGAQALIRAQQGEITTEEALQIGESERKATRTRLLDNFTRTGALPPGIQADVRQLQRLPNVQEAVGAVAPPVISVTNVKIDIPVKELSVGAGGTFTGTARENAREIRGMIKDELGLQIADAITTVLPSEVR